MTEDDTFKRLMITPITEMQNILLAWAATVPDEAIFNGSRQLLAEHGWTIDEYMGFPIKFITEGNK